MRDFNAISEKLDQMIAKSHSYLYITDHQDFFQGTETVDSVEWTDMEM